MTTCRVPFLVKKSKADVKRAIRNFAHSVAPCLLDGFALYVTQIEPRRDDVSRIIFRPKSHDKWDHTVNDHMNLHYDYVNSNILKYIYTLNI